MAGEIICKSDSVVPLLLSASGDSAESIGRRTLGLELLMHFILAQISLDASSMLANHNQQACVSGFLKC
jgi:hypothetical protein